MTAHPDDLPQNMLGADDVFEGVIGEYMIDGVVRKRQGFLLYVYDEIHLLSGYAVDAQEAFALMAAAPYVDLQLSPTSKRFALQPEFSFFPGGHIWSTDERFGILQKTLL